MKKIISGLLISIMLFAGCANTNQSVQTEGEIETVKRREITRADESNETEFETKTISDNGSVLEKSILLYVEEFKALDIYDISNEEKLSIILAAHYFNMQDRIDLETIEDVSPGLGELLLYDEEGLILNFLSCTDYFILAVEETEMNENTLSFNVVLSYTYNMTDTSMPYMKLFYRWENEKWICEEVIEADPEASQKPNYYLVMSKKGEESEAFFGVANLLDLFVFKGENYRAFYTEKYAGGGGDVTMPARFNDRDPNEEITVTDDGFFDITPEQLKQNINNEAGYELITSTCKVLDQGNGLIYEYIQGETIRLILLEDIESENIYSIAVIQMAYDEKTSKIEEDFFYDLISCATRVCNPEKDNASNEAAVALVQKVISGEVGDSVIELGAINIGAYSSDRLYHFFIESIPLEYRTSGH